MLHLIDWTWYLTNASQCTVPYRRRFVEKTDEIWRFPPETANSYLVLISDIEMKRNIRKIRSRNNTLSERKISKLCFKQTDFLCFFDGQLSNKVIKFVEFQALFFFRGSPNFLYLVRHFPTLKQMYRVSVPYFFTVLRWKVKQVNSGKSKDFSIESDFFLWAFAIALKVS